MFLTTFQNLKGYYTKVPVLETCFRKTRYAKDFKPKTHLNIFAFFFLEPGLFITWLVFSYYQLKSF